MINAIDWGIQDRGPWIGQSQIMAHIPLASIDLPYPIRQCSDDRSFTSDEAIEYIKKLRKKPVQSLAIVGGDPMIAVDTVIPIIQSFKGSVYIETPGVFPDRVLECIEWVDSWCIDLVLGSETDALEAIQAIQDDTTCFARFTVSSATTVDELKLITDGLGMIGGQVPVIIQPVGAFSGLKDKASDADIIRALHWLSKSSPDVRVIQPTQRWVGSE